MPGCMASSTRRTFSATDQRRRRCTEVITSTRLNGTSEALDIVVLIGACLCLIGYADCPVKTECAPSALRIGGNLAKNKSHCEGLQCTERYGSSASAAENEFVQAGNSNHVIECRELLFQRCQGRIRQAIYASVQRELQ